jgi:hypothetical protein
MRGKKGGRRRRSAHAPSSLAKRILFACSLLVVTVLLASLLASRAKDAAGSTETPPAPLPKTLAPKDTTPPATVQNLRRTDTVDRKAVLASGEARRP